MLRTPFWWYTAEITFKATRAGSIGVHENRTTNATAVHSNSNNNRDNVNVISLGQVLNGS